MTLRLTFNVAKHTGAGISAADNTIHAGDSATAYTCTDMAGTSDCSAESTHTCRTMQFAFSPVSPDPPIRDAALSQEESTHKQQDQEEEATASASNDLIPSQRPYEPEEGNAHTVHQEQEQNVGEEPAQTQSHEWCQIAQAALC